MSLVASAAPAATATAPAAVTTTAAAAAASAYPPRPPPPPPPPRAIFLGLGFIDSQGAAAMFLAVEGGDSRLSFAVAAHLDKAEALALAGVAIGDDLCAVHGPVRGKSS